MNFWKLALTTLIIVASIGASARAGNNLVADGDFSVPYLTGGWSATPGFAGVSGDSPGNPGGAYNSPTGFGPLGATQNYWGYMQSYEDTNPFGYLPSGLGSLTQDITFGAAGSYDLTYYIAARNGNNDAIGAVTLGTGTLATFNTESYPNWTQINIPFTIAAPTTEALTFATTQYNSPNGYDNTALIDDVCITAVSSVPEPSTFALLGAAAIGLVGWPWRHRRS